MKKILLILLIIIISLNITFASDVSINDSNFDSYFSQTGTLGLNDGDNVKFTSNLDGKTINIDKNLSLSSDNGVILKNTQIRFNSASKGSSLLDTTIEGSGNLIYISNTESIKLSNNKITSSTSTGVSNAIIILDSTDISLIGNNIKTTQAQNFDTAYTINILDSTVLLESNTIITNTTAYSVTYINDFPRYKSLGVYIEDGVNSVVKSNTFITDFTTGVGGVDTIVSFYALNTLNLDFNSNKLNTHGNRYSYSGVFTNNVDLKVYSNNFTSSSAYYANGIAVYGNGTGLIQANTINAVATSASYGILTQGFGSPLISHTFTRNNITSKSNHAMGIEIYSVSFNNFTWNTILVDGEYGLGIGLLEYSRGNAIDYNTITSTGTKTGRVNYMDLLDFENVGITMSFRTDSDNSGLNYIRYNNITVKGEYTINLKNTSNNLVRANDLHAASFYGDESVYTNELSNDIRDNTPKIVTGAVVYVSSSGSSSNSGTRNSPVSNIKSALNRVNAGGEIIILDDIKEGDTVYITKSVTISGATRDVTIDGCGKDLFYIRSEVSGVRWVVIRNLNIINCSMNGAGVIFSFAPSLYLFNLTIYNNTDTVVDTGFYGPVSNYGTLYVEDCEFYRNHGNSGGAIYTVGDLYVKNSIFHDNAANVHGGAIAANGNTGLILNIDITNSTFYRNNATRYGGAVYTQYANLNMISCEIRDNIASAGGFLYCFGNINTKTNISHSVIINNPSIWGDIYTHQQNVYANYNWWGDNKGSTGRYSNSEGYPVRLDYKKSVVMTLNINGVVEDSIPTVIIGSLNKYNDGGVLKDLPGEIPSRTVSFTSNSGVFSHTQLQLVNGSASSRYTGRSQGKISVTIDNQVLELNTTVVVKSTSISFTPSTYYSNETIALEFVLSDSNNLPVSSGLLSLSLNGEEYYTSVNNGLAQLNLGYIDSGNYTFTAIYTPIDGRYVSSSNSFDITVIKSVEPVKPDTPTIPITPDNPSIPTENITNESVFSNIKLTLLNDIVGFTGEDFIINVNVSSPDGVVNSGILSLNLNNTVFTGGVRNGLGQITVKLPESPNIYASFITYSGNGNVESIKTTIIVKENISSPLNTTLYLIYNEYNNGQVIIPKLYATSEIKDNIKINITKLQNGQNKIYSIKSGENLELNIEKGEYIIKANYDGTDQYLPSTNEILITVTGENQTAKLEEESFITGNYGDKINYEGILKDLEGNTLVGYHIAVNITRISSGASKTYYLTTDYTGQYKLPINLAPGEYILRTTIDDMGYKSSTITNLTIERNPNETKIESRDTVINYGVGENFTATLKTYGGELIIGHPLDLTLSNAKGQSKTYRVISDYNGEFKLPINLARGTYIIQCTYDGLNGYQPAETRNTITVI